MVCWRQFFSFRLKISLNLLEYAVVKGNHKDPSYHDRHFWFKAGIERFAGGTVRVFLRQIMTRICNVSVFLFFFCSWLFLSQPICGTIGNIPAMFKSQFTNFRRSPCPYHPNLLAWRVIKFEALFAFLSLSTSCNFVLPPFLPWSYTLSVRIFVSRWPFVATSKISIFKLGRVLLLAFPREVSFDILGSATTMPTIYVIKLRSLNGVFPARREIITVATSASNLVGRWQSTSTFSLSKIRYLI